MRRWRRRDIKPISRNKEYNQGHNETKENLIMNDTIHTNETTNQNHIQGVEEKEKITRRHNKKLHT